MCECARMCACVSVCVRAWLHDFVSSGFEYVSVDGCYMYICIYTHVHAAQTRKPSHSQTPAHVRIARAGYATNT